MIRATIQGKDKANNRKHITAQNATLITGEAQTKCVNAILKDCKNVSVSGELYCELDNGKLFCALYHPEKDDIGRRRIALIVWDKDTSQELIQKTLEVMGLEFERFLELKREFESQKRVGVSKNTLVIIDGVALLVLTAYLFFKK